MPYSIAAFVGSLVLNAVLGYAYNKGSLAGGISLLSSIVGLGVVGGALTFGAKHRGTPMGSAGAGLFAGSVTTALLCGVTFVWIVLYMRGDI